MLSSRTRRRLLVGVVTATLLAGAWVGWTVWRVNRDLNGAVSSATAVKNAIQAGDTERVDAELATLKARSAGAAHRTSGPTWWALTKLPLFGDDAAGVKVTSRVLDDLADQGVAPLVEAADRLDELLPREGRIDVNGVRELQAPIAQAQQAFAAAEEQLAKADPSGFIGPLRTRFTEFRRQVHTADRAMSAAQSAAELLPSMLGGEGKRTYLLVFQNNAEIRATGGLPGSVAELRAENGKLTIVRQVAISSFSGISEPILLLTPAENELYTDALGRYFGDANFVPDMARTAALMDARWKHEFPGAQVDGVLMLDTVALSYVLEATGPITVRGVTLTGENAVDELLHQTYLRYEDPTEQDEFFNEVSSVAFERFTTGASNGTGLVEALARAADERRVFVHSFDTGEQAQLAGSPIAGEFISDPKVREPQIAVTLNDGTGSKMSYFLRYEAHVNATYCDQGAQAYTAKMRLESTAPRNAANLPDLITGGGAYGVEPGTQVVTVRVYGPAAGSIADFMLNGEPMNVIEVDQKSRPVAMTYIQLEPGQRVDLAWTMKSGAGQSGDADFTVTPGIEPQDNATTVASVCR